MKVEEFEELSDDIGDEEFSGKESEEGTYLHALNFELESFISSFATVTHTFIRLMTETDVIKI